MTNWIRGVKENPGGRMDLPPGKSDVTAMSYLTSKEVNYVATIPAHREKSRQSSVIVLFC